MHQHYCIHCRNLGGIAPGHPMNREMDSYRHSCPLCLHVWWSNDDAIYGVKYKAKMVDPTRSATPIQGAMPSMIQGIGRGTGYRALSQMRPNVRRF